MSTFANSAESDRVAQVLEEAVRDQAGASALQVTSRPGGGLDLEYSPADVDWRLLRSITVNHPVTVGADVTVAVTVTGGRRDRVSDRPAEAFVVQVSVDGDRADAAGPGER